MRTAAVLAAGLGVRMRPFTLSTPKPMLMVQGRPLLGWVLDDLRNAGVERVVVNTHHLPETIKSFVEAYQGLETRVLHEPQILDTGGGIKNMMQNFPAWFEGPFFVVNAEPLLVKGEEALRHLKSRWQPETMDLLMTVAPLSSAGAARVPSSMKGDFFMDEEEKLFRPSAKEPATHFYVGSYLLNSDLFVDTPSAPFSMNLMFDRAIDRQRLKGSPYDASWFYLSTPEDLSYARQCLEVDERKTPDSRL